MKLMYRGGYIKESGIFPCGEPTIFIEFFLEFIKLYRESNFDP